jgi:hypothetical protein
LRKNYRYAMWKLLSKEKVWKCKAHHYWPSWSHCIEYTSPWAGLKLTILVVIGTECIGSCKSNYHTKMTTTTLGFFFVEFFQKIFLFMKIKLLRKRNILRQFCLTFNNNIPNDMLIHEKLPSPLSQCKSHVIC